MQAWLDLPSFIRPVSTGLATEDLEYLTAKGAFVLPSDEFSKELLQCYTRFVHPAMPVFDRAQLEAIRHSCTRAGSETAPLDRISLILWQAMIFTATAVSVWERRPCVLKLRG